MRFLSQQIIVWTEKLQEMPQINMVTVHKKLLYTSTGYVWILIKFFFGEQNEKNSFTCCTAFRGWKPCCSLSFNS